MYVIYKVYNISLKSEQNNHKVIGYDKIKIINYSTYLYNKSKESYILLQIYFLT